MYTFNTINNATTSTDLSNIVRLYRGDSPIKTFHLQGPDSTTAYSATMTIYPSYDDITYDSNNALELSIVNTIPNASVTVETSIYGFFAKLTLVSGSVTTIGSTNGRIGISGGVSA